MCTCKSGTGKAIAVLCPDSIFTKTDILLSGIDAIQRLPIMWKCMKQNHFSHFQMHPCYGK